MDRRTSWGLGALLVIALVLPRAATGGPDPKAEGSGGKIAWLRDLPKAFELASAENKVLMVCINARNPIGERLERAAKGLREVVYLDPAVVKKSRDFVCVFVAAEGSSADYGELRVRLGIDGLIVSPQHIFVHPQHVDGTKPLLRKQYWSHGVGPEAVKVLIGMMDKALAAYRVKQGVPGAPGGDDGPNEARGEPSAAERDAWIKRLIDLIRGSDAAIRKQALGELVKQDRKGDCTTPLVALIGPFNAAGQVDALIDVVRALGMPGLEPAALALHELLKHKDVRVRGNTAVTLEYIGSAASVEPLITRAKREKNEGVANHICRALGRCGAGDTAARKRLLRDAKLGKDRDFGCFGAVIGLAYFQADAKAARALEKQLLKLGSPLQGGLNTHTFLRAALAWCLSEIRDPKTARLLRKKIIAPLAEEKSPWKESVVRYYEAIARKCEGRDDAQAAINAGIRRALWVDDARELVDAARRGRSMSRFKPKGEWGNKSEDD